MLYHFLKPFAKLAIIIFLKKRIVNKKKLLYYDGPLLLAANHPNSFLDAILLCASFRRPVYALARGDAFKKRWIAKILYSLHMLPVYREKEGTENVHLNFDTFNKCVQIFKQKGIILIFSEALCINEWHLRRVKKGTARLAALAWKHHIALSVLPVGINYSNFKAIGKIVHINFGDCITRNDLSIDFLSQGKLINMLTDNIQQQLSTLVYEINATDISTLKQYFYTPANPIKNKILILPALVGWLLHIPFYYPLSQYIYKKAASSGHYDSILMALLFLSYFFVIGIYVLLISMVFSIWWGLLCILLIPFFAWSYIQIKKPYGSIKLY